MWKNDRVLGLKSEVGMKTSTFENGKTNNAEGIALENTNLFVNLGGMRSLEKFGYNLYRAWCVFSFLLPFACFEKIKIHPWISPVRFHLILLFIP